MQYFKYRGTKVDIGVIKKVSLSITAIFSIACNSNHLNYEMKSSQNSVDLVSNEEGLEKCIEKEKRFAVLSSFRLPIPELVGFKKENATLFIKDSAVKEGDNAYYESKYDKIHIIEDFYSGVTESLVMKEHKKNPFTNIIATNELDLIRAARIREILGLYLWQDYKSAIAYRDKFVMKTILSKVGIKTPQYSTVCTPSDLVDFQARVGFPFILKPATETGAKGVVVIKNFDQLYKQMDKFLPTYREGEILLEEFIEGNVYHIDGIVKNGESAICWPSIYISSCLEMVNKIVPLGWHLLESTNPLTTKLVEYTQKVVKELPSPKDFIYHVEAFINKYGEIVFCEAASRPGGGGINEDWIESFGINLFEDHIRCQAGLYNDLPKLQEPKSITGWMLFPKKQGIVKRVPEKGPEFPWILRSFTCVKEGEHLNNPNYVLDFIFRGQIKAETEKEFNEYASILTSWVNENFEISIE